VSRCKFVSCVWFYSLPVGVSDPGGSLDRPVKSLRAPCPDGLARDGTQEVGQALYYPAPGVPLVVGVTSASREGERDTEFARRFPRANPPQGGPGRPFYRGKERVQTYNGGRSLCANVSGSGVPKPCVHANVVVGGGLGPCTCDGVAVGGAPESCRSTAGSAARILLTSPCCRKGLRATGVMVHAGHHHYLSPG
jgi:hypothetical protein